MNFRVKSLGGVFVLTCGLLFVIAIWPACACVPIEYREVPLDEVPAEIRANAGKIEPGIRPGRAWAFRTPATRAGRDDGYLIRGRVPGGWWSKDIKVYLHREEVGDSPGDLRPVD